MENLFGAIAFTLFAVAQLAAVIFVRRMEQPLCDKYAANNDIIVRRGRTSSRRVVQTPADAKATQAA